MMIGKVSFKIYLESNGFNQRLKMLILGKLKKKKIFAQHKYSFLTLNSFIYGNLDNI